MTQDFVLRAAALEDVEDIIQLIHELAAYEKLQPHVKISPPDLQKTLFCQNPKVFCVIAEVAAQKVGFAIYFYNFSTFLGRHGLYIEDLYVRPDARGQGIGKGIFRFLAREASQHACGRMEWCVLNWNTPAIAFYKSLEAKPMDEWTVFRLEKQSLQTLCAI